MCGRTKLWYGDNSVSQRKDDEWVKDLRGGWQPQTATNTEVNEQTNQFTRDNRTTSIVK